MTTLPICDIDFLDTAEKMLSAESIAAFYNNALDQLADLFPGSIDMAVEFKAGDGFFLVSSRIPFGKGIPGLIPGPMTSRIRLKNRRNVTHAYIDAEWSESFPWVYAAPIHGNEEGYIALLLALEYEPLERDILALNRLAAICATAFLGIKRTTALKRDLANAEAMGELLAEESHHRIKNDLQVVASLLSLQAASISDDYASGAIAEAVTRVRAIASVHDLLRRMRSGGSRSLLPLIRDVARNVMKTYQLTADGVTLNLDLEDVTVSETKAIAIGLIVNELVSNAFRHGLDHDGCGTIGLALRRETKRLLLTVVNSCEEWKKGSENKDSSNFGLKLIRELTEQLGGSMTTDFGNVTQITVCFPE
jgi:two-component sensor histidine kinase